MKKIINFLLCIGLTTFCLFPVTISANTIELINTKNEFYAFMSSSSQYVKAKLNNDIVLESSILSYASKDIDMNGYSIIIPETAAVCIKASTKNQVSRFYSHGDKPIFIVEGILELYAGELSSSASGSLIKINNNGKLYTRNPLIDDHYYENNSGLDIGRPSIYDSQIVDLNIPNGTAIDGGKETKYYHTNIHAKTVIQSDVQPTFYYSTITSQQNVIVEQGYYNNRSNIKNIPIFKHQLVMAIDDSVDSNNIEKYLPKEIVTKDNQYITVHFDVSSFDDTLLEQTLSGEYHNINELYRPYFAKLELKIIKNQKIPLSQFYTTFPGVNSLSDTGILSPNASNPQVTLNINYTNADQIFIQQSSNIEFINYIEEEIDTWGYDYPLYKQIGSISQQQSRYFRIRFVGGLQEGYSNIIKIDQWQMSYVAEPESSWQEDTNDLPIVVPPPTTDNDNTETPEPLPDDGSEHRNDASIAEPDDKNEVIIKSDESDSNIKAKEDIIIDLEKHQVIIPYEIAKKYGSNDIIVKEEDNIVRVTSNNQDINEANIQKRKQTKTKSDNSYISYMIVGSGILLSAISFFKYQRRIK